LSKPINAYSFKQKAQVVYERPSRKEALAHAQATHGTSYDPIERQTITGCIAMVWPKREGTT
jgi:hypothetical protein